MVKGKCKLCLKEDVDLLTKSHIIPKFMFEDMKDDFNSIFLIEPEKYVSGRNQHIKKQRDSFFESNILCKNCDGIIIKRYEDYLKLTFYSTDKPIKSRPKFTKIDNTKSGFKICHIKDIDVNLYKLGFLSILWRASISSLPFFDSVDLGPHNEKVRKMIFTGESLLSNNYSFITSLISVKSDMSGVILPIEKYKLDFFTHYRLLINKFEIIFMVGSENLEFKKELLEFIPNNYSKDFKMIIHKDDYTKQKFESIIFKDKKMRPLY